MTIRDVRKFCHRPLGRPRPRRAHRCQRRDRRGDCPRRNDGLEAQGMLDHARQVGGPALRALTFHDRARMLKALALYLTDRKVELYEQSYDTGATLGDHKFDIDGGIGTVFVIASKGRREMPDAQVYVDGATEMLSRDSSFLGQHIAVPLTGVAVHINAYNFPVWGMLGVGTDESWPGCRPSSNPQLPVPM